MNRLGMDKPVFEPGKYWQERTSGRLDISVVGHRAFGKAYNRYIYQRRIGLIEESIRELNFNVSKSRILDVGCGSGFYADFWKSQGIKEYTGLDISRDSVIQLKKRHPEYTFIQVDITDPETMDRLSGVYDLITVFDVLYHIIDDHRLAMVFKMLNKWLDKDGTIFIFDQLLDRESSLTRHVKFRGRESYRRMLEEAGLTITRSRPLFLFLTPPVFGIKPLDILIAGGYKSLGFFTKLLDGFGDFIGFGLYHLDCLFLKRGVKIPNHELLIVERSRNI